MYITPAPREISQPVMSSKPYYGPQEDEYTKNLERFFVAGDFVAGVAYGARFVLDHPLLPDSDNANAAKESYQREECKHKLPPSRRILYAIDAVATIQAFVRPR